MTQKVVFKGRLYGFARQTVVGEPENDKEWFFYCVRSRRRMHVIVEVGRVDGLPTETESVSRGACDGSCKVRFDVRVLPKVAAMMREAATIDKTT